MATRIQQRRGTASEWSAANPTLAVGESGYERDTGVFKVGDGVTPWNDLEPVLSSTYATVFKPEKYGAKRDGTTDDTAAFVAMFAAAFAQGGIVRLSEGTYRINGQLDLPFTMNGTVPEQKAVQIEGSGAWSSGRGTGVYHAPTGGTILDLRYAGPGAAKILTRGFGRLTIRGVTFTDYGTSSTPFLKTTNTTLDVRGNAFIGNPTKAGTQCDQDAIILGGVTLPGSGDHGTTDDSPFQGYGTVIADNYFNRVRRIVFGQVYANGVIVRDNNVWQFSGSNLPGGACIEFNPGAASPQSVFGNVITGNLIEVGSYPYGILLEKAQGNTLAFNNFYDQQATTLAYIRTASVNAKYNVIYAGYGYIGGAWPGGVHVSEATPGVNTVFSGQAGTTGQNLMAQQFLSPINTRAAYSAGAGTPEIVFGVGSNLPGVYAGTGAPNFVAPTGSIYHRSAGDYGDTVYIKEAGDTASTGWVPLGPTAVRPLATRTGNATAQPGDRIIVCNATGPITITLPAPAAANAGKTYTVKNASPNTVTVAPASGTLDGAANTTLVQWAKVDVVSDGTQWLTV